MIILPATSCDNSIMSRSSSTDKSARSSLLLIFCEFNFITFSSDSSSKSEIKLSLPSFDFFSSKFSSALFLNSCTISSSKSSIELNSSCEQYAISLMDENPLWLKRLQHLDQHLALP